MVSPTTTENLSGDGARFNRDAPTPSRPLQIGSHPVTARLQFAEDGDPRQTSDLRKLLTLALVAAVVVSLYAGRAVMLPITLAVLLSFVLAPLVDLLHRFHLGRVLSVLLAVLLALSVIGVLSGLIGMQIAGLTEDFPFYANAIERKVEIVRGMTLDRVAGFLARATEYMQPAAAPPSPDPSGAPSESTMTETKPIPVEVHQPTPTALDLAQNFLGRIIDPLSTTAIVFIVTIFILLQREDLRDRLIRLFGSSDLHRTTGAITEAVLRLSRYFLTQLGINVAFGLVIGVGLYLIGVPSPALWGTLGMLLRFVPYIGAPLAAVLPLALAAAVDSGWSMLFQTLAVFAVVEVLAGHVVEPMLYGRGTGLSPLSVVVAATFWTWLWGPIGLILATPLTLCLVVLGRHVEQLEFLDVLLGDRPALTPVESFYQRMLAGDPDEAYSQAEQFLKDQTLPSYYDSVAVPGLRMAAADLTRGVLTAAQMARFQASILSLIADLDDHVERQRPPPKGGDDAVPPSPDTAPPTVDRPTAWRTDTPVLCIAGRDPLDDAAATMLAQLLRQQGIGARVEPFAAATRAGIGALNTSGVAMICLCYVELSGSPSHMRYALRRLRQHVPGASLLAGLWYSHDPVLRNEGLRATIGADHSATSLQDAVTICLTAASANAGS